MFLAQNAICRVVESMHAVSNSSKSNHRADDNTRFCKAVPRQLLQIPMMLSGNGSLLETRHNKTEKPKGGHVAN